ncbi:hypothetical protein HY024_01510, partial [Candidatus Curtissbacteria bacterium]|nr:hypothetical protein [Candidatus Curtissbacteria bacterium]
VYQELYPDYDAKNAAKIADLEIAEVLKPPSQSDDLDVAKIQSRIEVVAKSHETGLSYADAAARHREKNEGPHVSEKSRIVETETPLAELDRERAQAVLNARHTIDRDGNPVVLSSSWNQKDAESRNAELMITNGVSEEPKLKPLIEIRGGATRYTTASNATADIFESRRRLREMSSEEDATTYSAAALQADRTELLDNLKRLRDAELATVGLQDGFSSYSKAVPIALDQLKVIRSIERGLTGAPLPTNVANHRTEVIEFLIETQYNSSMDVVMKMADVKRHIDWLGSRTPPLPVPSDLQDELEGLRPAFDAMVDRLIGAGGVADWKGATDLQWGRDRDFALEPGVAGRTTLADEKIAGGYKYAFDFFRSIGRAEILALGSGPDAVTALNSIISLDQRDSIKFAARKMARFFEGKKSSLPRYVQEDLFKEINRQTKALEDSARLYGYTPEIYDYIMGVQSRGLPERRGYEGLVEWQATEAAQGYRSNFDDENESGPPKNWRDSWKHALNNLRAVESEDLPVQALQGVLEKVARIGLVVGQIGPASPDKGEADAMRERVEKLYKAVFAKVQERETLQSSGWDPDKVGDVYFSPNWTDETFRVYYERFNEDDEGHKFQDIKIDPKTGEHVEFNLLDKAMQLYFKDYAEERRKLNMVEGLTLMNLHEAVTAGNIPSEVQAIFKKKPGDFTPAEIDRMERVRKELALVAAAQSGAISGLPSVVVTETLASGGTINRTKRFHELDDAQIDAAYGALTAADLAKVQELWRFRKMRGVISQWMLNRTLVGATNTELVDWEDPVTHLNKQKTMLEWRKLKMTEKLDRVNQTGGERCILGSLCDGGDGILWYGKNL